MPLENREEKRTCRKSFKNPMEKSEGEVEKLSPENWMKRQKVRQEEKSKDEEISEPQSSNICL